MGRSHDGKRELIRAFSAVAIELYADGAAGRFGKCAAGIGGDCEPEREEPDFAGGEPNGAADLFQYFPGESNFAGNCDFRRFQAVPDQGKILVNGFTRCVDMGFGCGEIGTVGDKTEKFMIVCVEGFAEGSQDCGLAGKAGIASLRK